jgi:hypothetical protein
MVADPAQEGKVANAESAKKSLDYVTLHRLDDEYVTHIRMVFKHLPETFDVNVSEDGLCLESVRC